jgi:cyclophilin family peptidyl-prolyl cis-trans isomerase
VKLAPVLAAGVLALAGCGGESDETTTTTAATPTTTTETAGSASGACKDVAKPKAEARKGTKPTEPLDPSQTYRLVFATNCGSFTVTLDQKLAPNTAASLVELAKADYFDDTVFHRIVPGFVIQGGDPTAKGSGGPGYSTVDPPPPTAAYAKGVVAMAKTQTEAPGTAGSQFFVVTAPDAGLPAEYAIVGKVTEGLPVVERIGRLGNAAEQPTRPVVITDVAVETS